MTGSCEWCGDPLRSKRRDARFCCVQCRQTAWRLRGRSGAIRAGPSSGPGERFAYADPPYPGKAHYYRHHPDYGGEVDHQALIERLEAGNYAGWALSTSADALRDVLAMCPPGARPCPWVKPIPVRKDTYGIDNSHEYVIIVGGRKRRPGVRDWLRAMPARGGKEKLVGRKPPAFNAWLFDLLGMLPGDELDDLFPGTGGVGRSWQEVSRTGTEPDSSRTDLKRVAARSTTEASPSAALRVASAGATERVQTSSATKAVADPPATSPVAHGHRTNVEPSPAAARRKTSRRPQKKTGFYRGPFRPLDFEAICGKLWWAPPHIERRDVGTCICINPRGHDETGGYGGHLWRRMTACERLIELPGRQGYPAVTPDHWLRSARWAVRLHFGVPPFRRRRSVLETSTTRPVLLRATTASVPRTPATLPVAVDHPLPLEVTP